MLVQKYEEPVALLIGILIAVITKDVLDGINFNIYTYDMEPYNTDVVTP